MLTRALVVGDMHPVPDELGDCGAALDLILKICRTDDIKEVWFMGDQHHTHAVLRLEVMHWWRAAFKALRNEGISSLCIVGNHDQEYPGSNVHAMSAYEGIPGVAIVDKPTVHRGVLFLPYYHEEKLFQEACQSFRKPWEDQDGNEVMAGPETVFCHQTFDGSLYENGFPASDGFDPNLPPQELIVSGHIHTAQEFGKVWYVGAPRWRSLSDANVERSIWVVEIEGGKLVKRTPHNTGDVCRQIRHLEDSPAKPVQLPLDPKHQWRVDIKGPLAWCQARKNELSAAGARVRTFPDQVSTEGRIRESDGITKAFQTYLGAFQSKHGTARPVLEQMAKERLSV